MANSVKTQKEEKNDGVKSDTQLSLADATIEQETVHSEEVVKVADEVKSEVVVGEVVAELPIPVKVQDEPTYELDYFVQRYGLTGAEKGFLFHKAGSYARPISEWIATYKVALGVE